MLILNLALFITVDLEASCVVTLMVTSAEHVQKQTPGSYVVDNAECYVLFMFFKKNMSQQNSFSFSRIGSS